MCTLIQRFFAGLAPVPKPVRSVTFIVLSACALVFELFLVSPVPCAAGAINLGNVT
jgi:hypothetical protein